MWRKKRVLCQPVIDRCCGQDARAPARGLAVRRNVRTEYGARKGFCVSRCSTVAAGRMPAPGRADLQSAEMSELNVAQEKGFVSAGDRPLLRAECPRAGARTCSPQKRQN